MLYSTLHFSLAWSHWTQPQSRETNIFISVLQGRKLRPQKFSDVLNPGLACPVVLSSHCSSSTSPNQSWRGFEKILSQDNLNSLVLELSPPQLSRWPTTQLRILNRVPFCKHMSHFHAMKLTREKKVLGHIHQVSGFTDTHTHIYTGTLEVNLHRWGSTRGTSVCSSMIWGTADVLLGAWAGIRFAPHIQCVRRTGTVSSFWGWEASHDFRETCCHFIPCLPLGTDDSSGGQGGGVLHILSPLYSLRGGRSFLQLKKYVS